MSLRRCLFALAIAVMPAWFVLLSARAHAEAPADARLLLRIEGSINGVSAEQLRSAISAELGVRVDLESPGMQGRGTVVVRFDNGNAIVSFDSGGKKVTRTIPLPKQQAQISVAISLLVGNLARDEAADLLAELQISVTVGASASSSASTSASEVPRPEPPPTRSPPPLAAGVSPRCTLKGATFGADFFPFVGHSTTAKGRSANRFLSFNGIGGYTRAVSGFELSAGFNTVTESMCGMQLAAGANVVTGEVRGVQLSGGFNLAYRVYGFQLTGGVNVARDVKGMQLAPINIATGRVDGVQLGVVNVADEVDVPIGVISIVRHGRTHLDLISNESGLAQLFLVHGGRRVHNLWGLGVQADFGGDRARLAASIGMGVRAVGSTHPDRPGDSNYTLDIDAIFTSLTRFRPTASQTTEFFTFQPELRALFGVPLGDHVSFVFGPNVRVLLSTDPATSPSKPVGGVSIHDDRGRAAFSTGMGAWLIGGVEAGLRF